MPNEPLKEAIETTDENGWLHRRCNGEVPENSKMIGGVLCRWWGIEEPEGVQLLNKFYVKDSAKTREINVLVDENNRLRTELQQAREEIGQHAHNWKTLRQHMGCDGSDLPQLMQAWDNLQQQLAQSQANELQEREQRHEDFQKLMALQRKLYEAVGLLRQCVPYLGGDDVHVVDFLTQLEAK